MIKLVDSQDAVPEALRATAIETKDGKFAYEEADPNAISEKAQQTINAARQEAKDAKKAAKEAEAKAEQLEQDLIKKGTDPDAIKKLEERYDKKIAEKDTKIADLEAKESNRLHEESIRKVARDAKYLDDRMDDFMLKAKNRTKRGDNGETVVLDANGNPTGESLQKALAEGGSLYTPWAVKGTGSSGSGSGGSDGGGGDATTYDPVKAGKEAAAQQKKGAEENKLAFR